MVLINQCYSYINTSINSGDTFFFSSENNYCCCCCAIFRFFFIIIIFVLYFFVFKKYEKVKCRSRKIKNKRAVLDIAYIHSNLRSLH